MLFKMFLTRVMKLSTPNYVQKNILTYSSYEIIRLVSNVLQDIKNEEKLRNEYGVGIKSEEYKEYNTRVISELSKKLNEIHGSY
jgi:hypothetical protein